MARLQREGTDIVDLASQKPLCELSCKLKAIFKQRSPGYQNEVKRVVNAYIVAGHEDWREYAFFNPHKYCRNLVEINKDFEIIVICWDANQESPIHNHSSQDCWFGVMQGTMEEVTYDQDPVHWLKQKAVQRSTKGDVGWIHDDNAIHKVRSVDEQGITLHIYSKPIPMCQIYCPLTKTVSVRRMGFFTVKGTKCPIATENCYRKLYQEILQEQSPCDSKYKELFQVHCSEEDKLKEKEKAKEAAAY